MDEHSFRSFKLGCLIFYFYSFCLLEFRMAENIYAKIADYIAKRKYFLLELGCWQ